MSFVYPQNYCECSREEDYGPCFADYWRCCAYADWAAAYKKGTKYWQKVKAVAFYA